MGPALGEQRTPPPNHTPSARIRRARRADAGPYMRPLSPQFLGSARIAMGAAMFLMMAAVWSQTAGLDVPPLPFDVEGVGVVGLAVLVLLGFATGRLYTRSQVLEMQASHTREIERMERAHERELNDIGRAHDRELADIGHDRDEWRTAHRISETGRVEEREHNQAFVQDVARPLQAFLEGVRNTASIRRGVEG